MDLPYSVPTLDILAALERRIEQRLGSLYFQARRPSDARSSVQYSEEIAGCERILDELALVRVLARQLEL